MFPTFSSLGVTVFALNLDSGQLFLKVMIFPTFCATSLINFVRFCVTNFMAAGRAVVYSFHILVWVPSRYRYEMLMNWPIRIQRFFSYLLFTACALILLKFLLLIKGVFVFTILADLWKVRTCKCGLLNIWFRCKDLRWIYSKISLYEV